MLVEDVQQRRRHERTLTQSKNPDNFLVPFPIPMTWITAAVRKMRKTLYGNRGHLARHLTGNQVRKTRTSLINSPANGSRVPPCPIFTISLLLFHFLRFGFPFFPSFWATSFSCSTNKGEVLIRFFMSLIMAIDVGPVGFATAKRPESGEGGRVSLGIGVLAVAGAGGT